MKDEELADKYAEEYFGKKTELVEVWKLKSCKENFLAGLKAGRPQWHEIESKVSPKREISKQYMPKNKEKVLLKYHFSGEEEIHISDGYYDAYDFEFHIANNPKFRIVCVIAWKEIVLPEFPKEGENYTVEQNTGENQIEGDSVSEYRPFNNCDELVEYWEKKMLIPAVMFTKDERDKLYRPSIWVKSKEYGTDNLIIAFDNDNESIGGSCVFFQDTWVDMKELFDNFTFLDGSPCGVEE